MFNICAIIFHEMFLFKYSPLSLSQIPRDKQIYFEISVDWDKERVFHEACEQNIQLNGPYPKH